ncbi:ABC transporter permease subunit [Dactylosporangium sp. NPDC050688]|uniref:ABC transporter permease n=1 Tax=Dactylosporangium sp. NPDC050688 TaxID=3157217 RepID=UPI0033FE265E
MTTEAAPAREGMARRLSRRVDRLSDRRFALLLFVPAAVLIGMIVLPPIAAVFVMSLYRIELLKDGPTRFLGLDNITRMFNDSFFVDSIPRTLWFAVGTTVLTIPLALATALLMNRRSRFETPLAVALLLPWAIAPIVTGFFWRFIFQPSFGLATQVSNGLGLTEGAVPWLQEPTTALVLAMIATAWRSVPLLALIILSALKAIPSQLYRAARMDGATPWQAFRSITLPSIGPTLLIATILQIIVSLQVFDLLFQLTRGGPGFETTTITYYIFTAAFDNLSLGYSAMLALFLMLIIVAASGATLYLRSGRVLRRRQAKESADEPAGRLRLDAAARSDQSPQEWPEDPRKRRRWTLPPAVRRVGSTVAIGALLVWSIGPTLWIVLASLQPESAVTSVPLDLTARLDFSQYADILTNDKWLSSIWVSLQITVGSTLLTLLVGALAAYPLARLDLPGKGAAIAVLMFTYTVPAIVLLIPLLFIFNALNLNDSVIGLIVAHVAFGLPLTIWLLRNIFASVPPALEASARMDGCTRMGTLFRVTIPSASAGLAATAILLLISVWNEFLFAVVLGNQGAVTVTRRIGYINSPSGTSGEPPYTYQAAAGIVAVLPVIVLVILFHRRIRSGLSEGYLKG